MANEHLRTAAANIQRAVSDVQQLQREIRADIENKKRECGQQVNKLQGQISQMEQQRFSNRVDDKTKLVIIAEQQVLNAKISKLQAETDSYAQNREQEASSLNGQVTEFQGLVSRLNNLA